MVVCAVVDCKNDQKTKGISFFSFPSKDKDCARYKIWVDRCKRRGAGSSKWEPHKSSRMCSVHFESCHFNVNPLVEMSIGSGNQQKRGLKRDAVPTLFKYKNGLTLRNSPSKYYESPRPVARKKLVNELLLKSPSITSSVQRELPLSVTVSNENEQPEFEIPPISQQQSLCDNEQPKQNIAAASDTIVQHKACEQARINSVIRVFSQSTECNGPDVHIVLPPGVKPTQQKKTYVKSTQTVKRLVTRSTQYCIDDCATTPVKVSQSPVKTTKEVQCMIIGDPLSVEDNDSEEEMEVDEEDDPTWVPADEFSSDDEEADELIQASASPMKERKYIVFQSSLLSLFTMCVTCLDQCKNSVTNIGTLIKVTSVCRSGHIREWLSGPMDGRLPVGNISISAGLLFSGCSPVKTLNFLKHSNIAGISKQTYFNIQKYYLIPAIKSVWTLTQSALIDSRRGQNVKLAGDGRCCSPGHTAKYGSYTLMDSRSGQILSMELIQSNEVKNSYGMELEGLKRGLLTLKQAGMTITDLVTDRHTQVRKWLRTEQPEINHWFDIWHIAKSVYKKLEALSKKQKCGIIHEWAKSISNHIYWCAMTSGGNGQLVVEKWTSIERHVTNIHEGHGDLFTRCSHSPINRNWIAKGSKAHKELKAVVCSSRLKQDIRQLSYGEQTAHLESYHKVVCYFATKHGHFFYESMEARLLLACLHFNENVNKDQAVRKDGTRQWKVSYSKARKYSGIVTEVKTNVTYDYVDELFEAVWELRNTFPTYMQADKNIVQPAAAIPKSITSACQRINKEDAIKTKTSRYNFSS